MVGADFEAEGETVVSTGTQDAIVASNQEGAVYPEGCGSGWHARRAMGGETGRKYVDLSRLGLGPMGIDRPDRSMPHAVRSARPPLPQPGASSRDGRAENQRVGKTSRNHQPHWLCYGKRSDQSQRLVAVIPVPGGKTGSPWPAHLHRSAGLLPGQRAATSRTKSERGAGTPWVTASEQAELLGLLRPSTGDVLAVDGRQWRGCRRRLREGMDHHRQRLLNVGRLDRFRDGRVDWG
jgi:hypothetical protein